ncbi:MAG: hypothetical protein OEY41_11800 [Acidimicrobiia bacterium]|nr:hypothetical protein [Acidimicrobiia bacterium]
MIGVAYGGPYDGRPIELPDTANLHWWPWYGDAHCYRLMCPRRPGGPWRLEHMTCAKGAANHPIVEPAP